MSLKERINQAREDIENKSKQPEKESQERYQRVKQIFTNLQLNSFFEELKNDVWGVGEVTTHFHDPMPNSNGTCSILLETTYPVYREGKEEYDSEGFSTGFTEAFIGSDYKYIRVMLIEHSKDSETRLSFSRSLLGKKNEECIETQIAVSDNSSYGIQPNNIEFLPPKPEIFDEQYKNLICETILKHCAKEDIKGNYPITNIIEKERQKIIEKINSGFLLIEKVPDDFFSLEEKKLLKPPQPPEIIKVKTQKRSFLDKLLGK